MTAELATAAPSPTVKSRRLRRSNADRMEQQNVPQAPKRTFRKFVTGVVFAAVLGTVTISTVGTSTANAITPAQSTSVGTVNALYNDINYFWSASFRGWGWSTYYRSSTVHFYNTTVTACGITLSPNNSYACSGSYIGNIWYGTGWTQGLLNRFGDYGAGVILAHEWGHEVMYDLGWTSRSGTIGGELFADCLAGMYTRYGITVSQRLNNSDYWEGSNTLASIAGTDHGTAQQRTDWYRYGYTSYNINSCYTALT